MLVSYVVSSCMVSGVGVWSPLGRVYLGHAYVWYVFGDRLGPGNPILGLAGGFRRCLWLGYCFGEYSGLVWSLVRFVEFSFSFLCFSC